DERKIVEHFGVTPRQLPIVLALAGDSSDNVKGARGFGKKNSVKIASLFKDVEEFKSALLEGSDPRLDKVYPHKDIILKNIEIVRLIPLGLLGDDARALCSKLKISDQFFSIVKKLEFNSILKKYGLFEANNFS
ncbi:MAG: hypothetical protein NZT61_07705, partial [Deltaproteobacteria bacterium]|nr:hypothetical protein [Deltaproteobacteria bacterium]